MVRKIVLSLIAVFGLLAYATAQNRQVSGPVSDANGLPVAGATVIVDGTSLGTTTNAVGEFSLSAPANGTLTVTFVGYEPQQLPIAGKTRIDFTLREDAQAIDDVIVVAFGTAKKEAFTGSAAVIKSDEISKVQTSNVATALVGRVAGVQTSSASGDLGTTPSIRVRGFGSINAGKEPLWIVDGMPYEGDLNNLNTNDIKSITVLKDAASNALYGARGANGVSSSEAIWGYGGRYVFEDVTSNFYNEISDPDWRKRAFVAPDADYADYSDITNLTAAQFAVLPAYANLKFHPGEGETATYSIGNVTDIPMMRVEEMYLIEAEATAHTNATAGLNLLRAFMANRDPDFTSSAATSASVVEEVIWNKRIELWGEGIVFYDIKRLNYSLQTGYVGTNVPSDCRFATDGRAPWWNFCIPETETQQNAVLAAQNNPNPVGIINPWVQ